MPTDFDALPVQIALPIQIFLKLSTQGKQWYSEVNCNLSNCREEVWAKKLRLRRESNPCLPDTSWALLQTELRSHTFGRGAKFSGFFKLSQGRFGQKNIHVVNKLHVINGCHLFFFDARNDCNNSGLPQWVRQWRVGSITSVEQILRQKRKVSWRNHSSWNKKVQFPCKWWKYHTNWNPKTSIFKNDGNWF